MIRNEHTFICKECKTANLISDEAGWQFCETCKEKVSLVDIKKVSKDWFEIFGEPR